MPYRVSVLLCSLALAAVFTVIGWNLYRQVDAYFDSEIARNNIRFHNIYTVQNEVQARRSQALAYSISTHTEIQRLFSEASEAARNDRKHSGNLEGAHTARVRRIFQGQVKRLWDELHGNHEVKHLQFLFPDGTPFLRMDAPSIFDDTYVAERPMLAGIMRDRRPRGGFEVGHTYAGIRGIVAAERAMPDGSERLVGFVEVGFDMNALLNRLDKQLDIGMALLLDSAQVSGIMLERYRPATETRQSFILAASRPEAADWLKAGLLPVRKSALQDQRHIFPWKGRNFHLIAFALDDYRSQLDPQSSPPGTVLVWRDITTRVKRLDEDRAAAIINTFVAWVFAQIFLFALLYVLRNVWERQLKRNTATIEKLSRHNALLLNTAANGICGIDKDCSITFINRAALAMHGFRPEEVMGKKLLALFYRHDFDGGADPEKISPVIQTMKDGMPHEAEEWLFRRDGSRFPAKVAVTPILEQEQRNGAVIVFHDITEQRNRQEALLQLATTDSLTGVSNRRHFLDLLDAEQARHRRHHGQASILMTDLDFFKGVNDKHGHAAGDAVLSHFVHIVRQTIRRSDIIGRLGGEEFAILLPGDGTDGAFEFAERLRRTFENNPTRIGKTLIACTVSIGISDLRSGDKSADAPMRRADVALYAAKAAGRNCTKIYASAMRQTDFGMKATKSDRSKQ
ncbi:MAG: diguanylate cyclase [Azoarcus sp.]|jgi:diguanylate cyclase (GGDEF)-like protein/PAS domain S-box-containing protein|nr:diguanylate cyclase [Azoarcus sp.]